MHRRGGLHRGRNNGSGASVPQLVVVHFPLGAIAATHGGVTVRPSVKVPTPAIVGANGAGDAFAVGLLYAFHEGWSIPDALALAHATAAASLRQMLTIGAVEVMV